jgi:hypothetical protein
MNGKASEYDGLVKSTKSDRIGRPRDWRGNSKHLVLLTTYYSRVLQLWVFAGAIILSCTLQGPLETAFIPLAQIA